MQFEEGAKVTAAAYDFLTPQSPFELAFHKGDAMLVLNNNDPNWWWVRMPGGGVQDCLADPPEPDAHGMCVPHHTIVRVGLSSLSYASGC